MSIFKTFAEVQDLREQAIKTGIELFDNWFSKNGGMVLGSSIFVTGTSGAGKTTLAVYLMKLLQSMYKTVMYSREMTSKAVKEQTVDIIGSDASNMYIVDENDCSHVGEFIEALDELMPKVVIVDSLQVVAKDFEVSMSESEAQYQVIQRLRKWVSDNNAVLFIIGHNTKEGEFRGDNTIMQMFDAHMEMIHNKKLDVRTIAWGQKNRKGPLSKMYYEFRSYGIEFFSVEDYENTVGNFNDIMKTLFDLINVKVNKKHADYTKFKKEVNSGSKKIKNGPKANSEMLFLLETCINKYEGILK